MNTGIVKWWNDSKGMGFISIETGPFKGKDVFCHYTGITDIGFKTLAENARVTLDILKTERGLQATNVKKVGAE